MADNEVSSLKILLQAWLVSPDLYLNIISYKLPTLTFFIILEFVNITGRIFSTLNHKVSVSLRSKILDDGRRQWCNDQWIELSRTDCHESSHLARMNWVLVKMWTRMMRERVFGRRVATLITRLCHLCAVYMPPRFSDWLTITLVLPTPHSIQPLKPP